MNPLLDDLAEPTETVVLRIEELLCIAIFPPPPECYLVGTPREARVFIEDRGTGNQPPIVNFYSPDDGDLFNAPADITLTAFAYDPEGTDVTVEFLEGTDSLGFGRFVPALCPAPFCPYFTLAWSNVPAGDYTLRAKVTEAGGATTLSDPVHVSVVADFQNVVTIAATDPDASETSVPAVIDSALFTVTRSGGLAHPLEVYYTIGGTASNGVDYAAISNRVVIVAGESSATIRIVPGYDMLDEGVETVVLRLQEPGCIAIVPPPAACYRVGVPSEATACIRDFAGHPLELSFSAESVAPKRLRFSGVAGQTYEVEASTDLLHWEVIGTATEAEAGAFEFSDSEAANHSARFYRLQVR